VATSHRKGELSLDEVGEMLPLMTIEIAAHSALRCSYCAPLARKERR
jgi:hypothetical protein